MQPSPSRCLVSLTGNMRGMSLSGSSSFHAATATASNSRCAPAAASTPPPPTTAAMYTRPRTARAAAFSTSPRAEAKQRRPVQSPAQPSVLDASAATSRRGKSGPSYPFSADVRTFASPPALRSPSPIIPPAPPTTDPTLGLLDYASHQLRAQWDPRASLTRLFSRRSDAAIPIGSVVSVETWLSPAKSSSTTFSGVLIAVRRRGTSTSFVLRSLVQKLGVEVRFNLYSPLLKDVAVLATASGSKRDRAGKIMRTRRAKLYYLRKDQKRTLQVARILKARKNAQNVAAAAAAKAQSARAKGARAAQRAQ